jgi:hypothetical protein
MYNAIPKKFITQEPEYTGWWALFWFPVKLFILSFQTDNKIAPVLKIVSMKAAGINPAASQLKGFGAATAGSTG